MARAWWQDPITQGYNPPIEPGQDIGTPFRTPITALLPGTVISETYGGFGARVDIKTSQGDVYYQHLDEIASGLRVGSLVAGGQQIGLSGGQLFGGSLPNNPLNSTGPHIEVGLIQGGRAVNPFSLIAAGPQYQPVGYGSGGAPTAGPLGGSPTQGGGPTPTSQSSSSGGGLVNVNFPDPIAGLRNWVASGLNQAKSSVSGGGGFLHDNIIPLVIAGIIILIVLGTGQQVQKVPQPMPIPVPV